MATFITSKQVNEFINPTVEASTGYWKYNHNSTDSPVFPNGLQDIEILNLNGEFTIIPCLADGTPSGDIILLNIQNSQLTSFDTTGLTSLTELNLSNNQLTSFDGTPLTNLQYLYLNGNPSINTPVINNDILSLLASNELSNGFGGGKFYTLGGRTTPGTTDYDYLILNNWDLQGLDLIPSPTRYLVDNINNPNSEQLIYGFLNLPNLPTSDPGVPNQLWVDPSNDFVVKVSQ